MASVRGVLNPPMGQVIGGWLGAMVVLGIAGGYLWGPVEVTLHVTPARPGAACSPLASAQQSAAGCRP